MKELMKEPLLWLASFLGLFLACFFSFIQGAACERDRFQKDAVASGVAEYYLENGGTQWRWKPPSK